ncbi:glycosyltransferase family 1 protein [Phenylobacterium hankyongense]|uniref:Glycosyltransferase family 1 protein n=1 Tax=Phenylobacterium hankyongense TaxID=1813876 RepID=A0A328B283_9CAUL|nr:glycosyltransferase family 4 protein [Phenylobacterium hankyongense]RAK60927.1 glycosyltransferase family 1 protein [Phenylobacterium hankyongense]
MTADAVGGVWTYAVDLALGLAGTGIETTLVVLGPPPTVDQVAQAHAAPRLRLLDTRLPLDWMASEPAEILEVAAVIRGLARGTGADLIHLNSPALAAGGGFAAPVVGVCHSCLATWWSAVKDGPMPPDFRWRSRSLRRGMLACDALMAPTAAFAAAAAETYALPRPLVVRNGRTPPALPTGRRERMVFTSGRLWDEGKNIAVLDAAAALMGAPLYAAGPSQGPSGEPARLRHARALGRLPAEAVADWLTRAPVYASAALYEPFGLGVLEAAQAGCALVLSDIATFRELWDEAAVFVDPGDAREFAAACDGLLADPALAARLGTQARARAGRYTVEAMTAGVVDVYGRVRPDLFTPACEAAVA